MLLVGSSGRLIPLGGSILGKRDSGRLFVVTSGFLYENGVENWIMPDLVELSIL